MLGKVCFYFAFQIQAKQFEVCVVWICGIPGVHAGALPPIKPLNKGSNKFPLK